MRFLVITALVILGAATACAQTPEVAQPAQAAPPIPKETASPSQLLLPLVPPPPVMQPAATPLETRSTYTPGEGLTVSMLDGTSSLKLFGQFSTVAVAATSRTFPTGGTLFLFPPSLVGNRTNTFDINARQSAIGAVFTGQEIMGLTPGAYFLGFIQNDNLTSDAYGFMPFNAYGELKNDEWRFAGGLMRDVFNPVNPTLISLLNLYASGNTGSFRSQIRAEHYYKPFDEFQLTTQVALSKPVASVVTNNRVVEDNGWPNIEGRVAAGIGAVEELAGGRKLRPYEFGVSGLIGQIRNSVVLPNLTVASTRSTVTSWGLGFDAQVAVTKSLGFAGEFFTGSGIGEYNAAIGQTFNSSNYQAIRATGGFGEVYYYFTNQVHLHSGYGIDAPVRQDLAPTQIARNQTYYSNLVWEVAKSFQVSTQVEYRRTDYILLKSADAVVFSTQFLWRF